MRPIRRAIRLAFLVGRSLRKGFCIRFNLCGKPALRDLVNLSLLFNIMH